MVTTATVGDEMLGGLRKVWQALFPPRLPRETKREIVDTLHDIRTNASRAADKIDKIVEVEEQNAERECRPSNPMAAFVHQTKGAYFRRRIARGETE